MKKTTLFKSGNSQAMRVPKEFRFEGGDVYIQKFGSIAVIIDGKDPWASLKMAQLMVADDFMKNGRQQKRIKKRSGLDKLFK